jgi:hypothetical protein
MRAAGFTLVLLANLITSIAFASLFMKKPFPKSAKISFQYSHQEHFLNQSDFLMGP